MAEVAARLGVGSLTRHGLAFERVVDAALDERGSGPAHASSVLWYGAAGAAAPAALPRQAGGCGRSAAGPPQ